MQATLPTDQATLAAFCRRHGIKKLSLFGSMLRALPAPPATSISLRSSTLQLGPAS